MTRVYVAARYGRMVEMRGVHAALREVGCEPTSRWVDGEEEKTSMSLADAALMDAGDVIRADVLLFFAEPHGSSNVGGGRHFEMGFATALGKRIVVVGERETVFCNLRAVEVVPTVQAAMVLLDCR